ncbi:LysE family translocator [Salinarimonas sp.]|uniref:LysE family translocator n=1 Tax=Salinarimonas sp. TaxID=2766526 RepID=UPI00391A6A63
MDASWLAATTAFAVAMAATPGPNNALVTAAGATWGFRKTLPLMAGIGIGVAGAMLVVALAGTAFVADPRVQGVVRFAGLAYLLYLAWRIATATPRVPSAVEESGERDDARPPRLLAGVLFQVVNPKLWAMAAGAVATYGTAANLDPLALGSVFALVFGAATLASVAAWTLVGIGVARAIRTERGIRWFNRAMAALLVASLVPLFS